MHPQVTAAHGIVLEPDTLEIDLAPGRDILVEGIRSGVGLSLVEVIARLGEDDPLLAEVDAGADQGGEVLSEETFLLERGAVLDIDVHLQDARLDLVSQRDVVDELTRTVFDHVDGIGGLEDAEVAVPHEVVRVDALHGGRDERRVGHLQQEEVLAGTVLIVEREAHLIAAHVVPEIGAIVDVDRVGVVFPAADGHHLLACREVEAVVQVPVEVGPVGALEKGVGEADVGRVDALAEVVGELVGDGTVDLETQVLPLEAVGGTVVVEIVLVGEIGTGVKVQGVQGEDLLLGEGLQEAHHAGGEDKDFFHDS